MDEAMGKIEKGMKEFFKNPFGSSSSSKDKKFQGTGHVIGTKADQQRLAVRTQPNRPRRVSSTAQPPT